ncbi:hypothetical protein E1287_34970 [Actinomadura sp. KC06]|uniref:hypothetical protein n=1 Tax=Actinomadura sp. KC06 TaxID=2530369 RepID=UPI00104F56D8|nr:hypothetical protein [Actinomadura sp. KC06]TDD27214.1 hypothetical protein E1287_34970 [Actinomadura sp. KC06]
MTGGGDRRILQTLYFDRTLDRDGRDRTPLARRPAENRVRGREISARGSPPSRLGHMEFWALTGRDRLLILIPVI